MYSYLCQRKPPDKWGLRILKHFDKFSNILLFFVLFWQYPRFTLHVVVSTRYLAKHLAKPVIAHHAELWITALVANCFHCSLLPSSNLKYISAFYFVTELSTSLGAVQYTSNRVSPVSCTVQVSGK